METSEIIKMILQILACFATLAITWAMPKIRAYFKEKLGEETAAKLENYVKVFVEAAEQLLKADDPTGEKRKQFVIEQLTKLGYIVSEYIDSLIESEVLKLNNSLKEE